MLTRRTQSREKQEQQKTFTSNAKTSSSRVERQSRAIQCELLVDKQPVRAVPIVVKKRSVQLSGDYMSNLLSRMNEPDPRDL